jgi:uncharacterized repeat protein (TIGR03803 family)
MRAKVIAALTFLFFFISGAQAGNQKVLYTFTGGLDGGQPLQAGVVFDRAGNLYGVTEYGGAYNLGTVFQLTPTPTGEWTERVLHSFTGGADGELPQGGLVIDAAGNLYGTASFGGDSASGCGTVFGLSPSGSGWAFTVLHSFAGAMDGCSPQADLSLFDDYELFGTAAGEGAGGLGTVFTILTTGTRYSMTPFQGSTGMYPSGLGLFAQPFEGYAVVYGTTYLGGMQKVGNVFGWGSEVFTETEYDFSKESKAGYYPIGDLATQDIGGVWMMYGTTSFGGVGGGGSVYQLTQSQVYHDSWTLAVLHSFSRFSGLDGFSPWAGPVLDSAGNLYGTTQYGGGPAYGGTVFRLTPGANNKWTYNILYSFTGGTDGSVPTSGLILDQTGNLYGTTNQGGAYNKGVVYEIVKTTGVVRPAALTFGPQPLNTTSPPQRISLFNHSSFPMNVTNVSTQGEFAVSANKCQNGIQPNTHCDVYVTFTPTGSGTKPRTGSITFADSAFNGPQSAPLTGTIPAVTRTTVSTSGSPSFVGQPVTFTAYVTSTNATPPDGDLVTFFDGNTPLGSAALTGGSAVFTTSSLTAPMHIIKAVYTGERGFDPSAGNVLQVVDRYSTTTALRSSPNPSASGQAVTFAATVTSAGPTLTGKVWFKDGATGIATVPLNGGVATFVKPKFTVGTHPITAEYLGDAASTKSTSSVLNQVVH